VPTMSRGVESLEPLSQTNSPDTMSEAGRKDSKSMTLVRGAGAGAGAEAGAGTKIGARAKAEAGAGVGAAVDAKVPARARPSTLGGILLGLRQGVTSFSDQSSSLRECSCHSCGNQTRVEYP